MDDMVSEGVVPENKLLTDPDIDEDIRQLVVDLCRVVSEGVVPKNELLTHPVIDQDIRQLLLDFCRTASERVVAENELLTHPVIDQDIRQLVVDLNRVVSEGVVPENELPAHPVIDEDIRQLLLDLNRAVSEGVVPENELLTDPDIDEDIRQLLVDLNRAGLKTKYSCSGHGDIDRALVYFRRRLSMDEKRLAKKLFVKYGYNFPVFYDGLLCDESYPNRWFQMQEEKYSAASRVHFEKYPGYFGSVSPYYDPWHRLIGTRIAIRV